MFITKSASAITAEILLNLINRIREEAYQDESSLFSEHLAELLISTSQNDVTNILQRHALWPTVLTYLQGYLSRPIRSIIIKFIVNNAIVDRTSLPSLTPAQIIAYIMRLGKGALNLSNNIYNQMSLKQAQAVHAALAQANIGKLDLSNNEFYRIPQYRIQALFYMLNGANITTLDLSDSQLNYLLPTIWHDLRFMMLNSNITILNLRTNYFKYLSTEQWQIFLDLLSESKIRELNLSGNNLQLLTDIEWQAFCNAIAKSHIVKLNLPGLCPERQIQLDALLENNTSHQRAMHFVATLEEENFQAYEVLVNNIANKLSDITLVSISPIIAQLEQQGTVLALFTAGLLLLYLAETTIFSENLNEEDELDCREKFMHDGVTYLIKALSMADGELKAKISGILWLLRTQNIMSSITERLIFLNEIKPFKMGKGFSEPVVEKSTLFRLFMRAHYRAEVDSSPRSFVTTAMPVSPMA